MKTIIQTDAAPAAIGPYSQAVRAGSTLYISGQIPLSPVTGDLVDESFEAAAIQVFENLAAVAAAAGGRLEDTVKLTLYLTDLAEFQTVNTVMARYFEAPYPARAAVQVAALPRGAAVEADAILQLD